ncbi:MAG: PHP domain-containing protein [Proteobacteria bacterium]|jgi:predicted metal-dependent phosphoesterase TrpH|nr:PHP domain-containing protein [Pseudomonadota bacterium]
MDTKINKIPVDLHCHSTYSDGAHSVKEVLDFVKANNGKHIALTDHDTVNGLAEARIYAKELELKLIGGVEISVTWDKNVLIHILGLGVDENNQNLVTNLQKLRSFRYLRGEKIAAQLEKAGIPNALEGALKYCQEKEALSRTHFARFLVENGYAKANRVFEKYLAIGRTGYVPQVWAELSDAVSWIKNSGGVAVIAHPARYKLTRTKLLRLISDFKTCGGEGIEVISSSHSESECMDIARIAQECNLLASMGTDFHNINNYPKVNVGLNYPLPAICNPIYPRLGIELPCQITI